MFRARERPATREDPHPAQHGLLKFGQQVVAPIEHRSQRAMPRQRRARTVGEQCEALIEPFAQFIDRQRAQARRSQFDRQRHAVEPRTDRCDIARVVRRQVEVGTRELRAIDKQAHAFVP